MIRFIKSQDGKLVNLNKVMETADSIVDMKENESGFYIRWANGEYMDFVTESLQLFLSLLNDLKRLHKEFTGLYFESSSVMLDALIEKTIRDA